MANAIDVARNLFNKIKGVVAPTVNQASAKVQSFAPSLDDFRNQVIRTALGTQKAIANQPLFKVPGIGFTPQIPSPTVGQGANFLKSVTLEPPARVGGSLALTAQRRSSFAPTTGFEKFLYGNQPIKSFPQQQKEASQFLQNVGVNKNASSALAAGGVLGMAALDVLPFTSGKGKAGVKGFTEAQKRLGQLLKYGDDLLARGFNKNQIDKIGINEYRRIIKDNISPFEHKTFGRTPRLFTDTASKQRSEIQTIAGGGKGYQGFSDNLKGAFQKWVNDRRTSTIEGLAQKNKFTNLDSQKLKGIFKFQAAEQKLSDPNYSGIKKFFDKKFIELKDAGVDVNYKQDYLPQLWQNSKEEVAQVFSKTLGLKPSFTIESVIKNYKEGIKAGLKPRFEQTSDLVGWYEQRANKALADRNFFNFLTKETLIQPSNKAPLGWKTLDPDRFPKLRVKTDQGEFVGTYAAPPDLADAINNYLKEPEGVLQNVANLASRLKNIFLSSGIPTTGLNFHGINILVRNTLSANNPASGFLKGTNYLLRPQEAGSYIAKNLDSATFASKHGLTLSTEDIAFNRVAENLSKNVVIKTGQKASELQRKLFEDPLFQRIIPALKLERFNNIYDDLVKSFPQEEAAKKAAVITNNIFGGINYDQLGRSKDFQNALRSTILASDWLETNIKLGSNLVKGTVQLNDPALKAYRTIGRNLVMAYMGASLTNKLVSGKWMHENDPGHTFEIQLGETEEGKKRYLRPFGTAADFIRIPTDVAVSLANGDTSSIFRVIRNRLSPVAGQLIGQLSNTNYLGSPIARSTQTPQEQVMARLGELSTITTPAFISSPIRALTGSGNQNLEQTIASAVEAPLRYSNTFQFKSSEERQAQQVNRQTSQAKAVIEKTAEGIVRKLKNTSKEERLKLLSEFESKGLLTEDVRKKIVSLQKQSKLEGQTPFVKAVDLITTNQGKANFIVSYFKRKATTSSERAELLNQLGSVGLLTDDLREKIAQQARQ